MNDWMIKKEARGRSFVEVGKGRRIWRSNCHFIFSICAGSKKLG